MTEIGRELVDLSLRANGIEATWRSFEEYLDRVDEQALGPNVAFLVGHGTVRGSVLGAEARAATPTELAAMMVEVEAALDAGPLGCRQVSSIRQACTRRRSRSRRWSRLMRGAAACMRPTCAPKLAIIAGAETGERPGRLLRSG